MYFSFVVEVNPVFACSSLLSNPVLSLELLYQCYLASCTCSFFWFADSIPMQVSDKFWCKDWKIWSVKYILGWSTFRVPGFQFQLPAKGGRRENRRGSRVNRLERCENAVPAPEWSKQNVLRWQFSKNSNLFNCVVALFENLAMSFLETSYPQSGSLMLHFPPPPKSTEVSTQPLPTSLK